MNGKTFISLFAGCGGSSLGYKLAGYKELLAIDNDKNSIETFKLNFDCPIWDRDIQTVSGAEILHFLKIRKRELFLLDGSPPCQGFSQAGKKKVSDSRNDLAFEFLRLVEEIEPQVFVMENVPGMIEGDMKGLFNEIMKKMQSMNYNIRCKLMNSKYYQVPQSRERIFWIGIRKDLNIIPTFPTSSLELISVKKAFEGLVNKTYYKGQISDRQKKDRLLWNRPSPVLIKVANSIRSSCVVHPQVDRHLTIEEAKRLCSFPDNFKLTGLFSEQWARLGNAVMPNQMKAIAKHIYGQI